MLIHSSHLKTLPPLDIQLVAAALNRFSHTSTLVVVLSKTLSWDKHIQFVHKKAAKGITLLCRLLWFLPRQALCSLYGAYMLPHLCYADAVWSTYTKTQSSSLEHPQNYAAHIILCRCRDASALNMQKEHD